MNQNRLAEIRKMRDNWHDSAVGLVLTELLVHIEEIGNTLVEERQQHGHARWMLCNERDALKKQSEVAKQDAELLDLVESAPLWVDVRRWTHTQWRIGDCAPASTLREAIFNYKRSKEDAQLSTEKIANQDATA